MGFDKFIRFFRWFNDNNLANFANSDDSDKLHNLRWNKSKEFMSLPFHLMQRACQKQPERSQLSNFR
jgi:hypothetical protein